MEEQNTIIISSDHAGYEMKEHIKSELTKKNISFDDVGVNSTESVHYPIYAGKVARAVSNDIYKRGIAICGSGIGASMTANRFRGVRAALCVTEEMARLSREHNNANVLVLGGRITSFENASRILNVWLNTQPLGGRHATRAELIDSVPDEER